MCSFDEKHWLLSIAVADIISRYPESRKLFWGSGFALFSSLEEMVSGGVFLQIGEALKLHEINPELFLFLLDKTLGKRFVQSRTSIAW